MVTVGINEVVIASALSAGVSCGLHGQWGGTEGHGIEGCPGREVEHGRKRSLYFRALLGSNFHKKKIGTYTVHNENSQVKMA